MTANRLGTGLLPGRGGRASDRRRDPIPQERVVRAWLARELDVGEDVPAGPEAALDALLSTKPGAASFIWRETPVEWYRVELGRPAFESLRPVGGPGDLLWRSVSTDGTLLGVAERCRADGPGVLSEAGIDAEAVDRYRDAAARGADLDPIVVRTRRGHTPWHVVDGNHRVTGVGLHYLETGAYDPVPAHLAVTGNPVAGPLRERVAGWLQRRLGTWPARRE